METTYKGVTTTISDNLFEPVTTTKRKPAKSYKFGAMSLYYDGQYYFPQDLKESNAREGKPYEIQVVYYQGKWYQDTCYITEELKTILMNAISEA